MLRMRDCEGAMTSSGQPTARHAHVHFADAMSCSMMHQRSVLPSWTAEPAALRLRRSWLLDMSHGGSQPCHMHQARPNRRPLTAEALGKVTNCASDSLQTVFARHGVPSDISS